MTLTMVQRFHSTPYLLLIFQRGRQTLPPVVSSHSITMILSRFLVPVSLHALTIAAVFLLTRQFSLAHAFHNPDTRSRHCASHLGNGLFSTSSDGNEYNVQAASVKLAWEQLEESSSRPILDLSSRDASPENVDAISSQQEEWAMGQKWQETKKALKELGISIENETRFLNQCPQLLRLDTAMILETAEWISQEFGSDYFANQPTSPKLLIYRLADVQYGIEFMSMMMMNDAKPFCRGSADFFQTAIDGGIQEQSVSKALGAASAATYQANQKVAGDAMSSLKSLKNRKPGL